MGERNQDMLATMKLESYEINERKINSFRVINENL